MFRATTLTTYPAKVKRKKKKEKKYYPANSDNFISHNYGFRPPPKKNAIKAPRKNSLGVAFQVTFLIKKVKRKMTAKLLII